MYTTYNFKTKKALKDAIAAGKDVGVFQPNDMFPDRPAQTEGTVTIEGPHYPEPHKWYGTAKLENGRIVSVK
jgi:hypothetical protein